MKKLAVNVVVFLVCTLLAFSHAARAQDARYTRGTEPENAPVKLQVLGLSKDRTGIHYRITVLTHKPIRRIELNVTAYTDDAYIGATTIGWPARGASGSLVMGHSYDCVKTILHRPLNHLNKLTVDRDVMHVLFADGTTWTSAGIFSGTGR